ncbi:hypothetical protein IVB41_26900 [Bradyrhizobium sp. 44]|uniref:hypothetical protein n=1 Tax=Bradyrhizobium sp. 44 TaxID=2782675 RepID=UPI001FF91B73|nr:hypothetical protein [Bradyrhizobium sp. 44]MCK1287538.1 hypothetical protein [Bradyrhizobium sp. 44]
MTMAEAVGVGLGFLAIVAPEFWPKMPKALSYTLAGIGLSWLTYSLVLGIESLSHMKLQYGPLSLVIVGAVLIAGGLFWHFSRLGTGVPASEAHGHATEAIEPKNRVAFRFETNAFAETKLVRWVDGTNSGLFETRFYLVVGNAMDTGRQIKNVKARIFFMGQEPRIARIKESGELLTDIRHGEWALFEVGKMVSSDAFPTGGAVTYGEEEKKRYEPALRQNYPKHLEVLLPTGQPAYGIFQDPDRPPTDWNMTMVVAADDIVSLQLKVTLDLMSKTPVTFQEIK